MLTRRCSPTPLRWSRRGRSSKKTPRTYTDYREMLKERDLDIVIIVTPDHWHALAMIDAVQIRRGCLGTKADQRRRRRGAGHAGRRAQVQACRAGRPAAPEHAASRPSARSRDPRRPARHDRPRGHPLLLPHAGDRESARHGASRLPGLRDVDRAGADAPLQRARASAQLARVQRVRQRHRRRHVRAHARHGALDDGPRHAGAHQLLGRHPRRQEEQGEHHGHANARRSTSATCRSSGRTARTATRRIRRIRGARRSTATRGRSGLV